jgi:RNA polymerase sigma-70 factor (ECF subfamily)
MVMTTAYPLSRMTEAETPVQDTRVGDRAPGNAAAARRDESSLMAAIATGDAAALDQVYLRYRPVAFAAAYALLSDPAAAEDAVHDAFLRIWRGAASFQPARGPLRAWLLTIVRNAAIDSLRARRTVPWPEATVEQPRADAPDGDDIFTTVAVAADARRVRGALDALPPPQRQAVELAFFGGLTHGEIAARTGVPLGTVKGRVRLGLRRLRHDLRDLMPMPATAE